MKSTNALKTAGINIAIFAALTSLILLALEILLHSRLINEDNFNTPTYIPRELKLKDGLIDSSGKSDLYGFRSIDGHNKINRLSSMQGKGCNIVVLGDSFVWGDGVGPKSRWVDVLDANLKDCRIHSFGRNGWSSLEQFQFYESHLKGIEFDHLLIGYVENDPHLALRPSNAYYQLDVNEKPFYSNWERTNVLVTGRASFFGINFDIPLKCDSIKCSFLRLLKNSTFLTRTMPRAAGKLKIRSLDYIEQKSAFFFNNFFNGFFPLDGDIQSATQIMAFGYTNWKNYLYEEPNFGVWKESLKAFANNTNHPVTFVITTTSTDQEGDRSAHHISQAISAIKESGLDHIDCSIRYQGLRPRSEWANAADGHPGANEVKHYATCAEKHLQQRIRRSI